MFKKFFGKKNDGFYMQADDTATPKAEAAPAVVDKPVETKTAESTPIAEVEVKEVATEAAPATAKTTKTSIKKEKKAKEITPEAEIVAPAAAQVVVAVAPSGNNFATDYLVTPAVPGNRRRPGANMKGFMSMAQEVKVAGMSAGAEIKAKKASKG